MRILFVADARSPIATNWIDYFRRDHEVSVLSLYPSPPERGVESVGGFFFRNAGRAAAAARTSGQSRLGGLARFTRAHRHSALMRNVEPVVASVDAVRSGRVIRRRVADLKPDLVHALRIPYEGIAASFLPPGVPLLVSIWGNDLTLHAAASSVVRRLTKRVLGRCDLLFADCERDREDALNFGFSETKESVVVPGCGGIRREIFYGAAPSESLRAELSIRPDATVVVNPRGIRAYVRNDTFFNAVRLIRDRGTQMTFVCPDMDASATAHEFVRRLDLGDVVRLLPKVAPQRMAELFRLAAVTVSPSEHDGTPNTLLEAMACGSLPVAGNIPSVREWIVDGENGFLIDPGDAAQLADRIIRAAEDERLRDRARALNETLIATRADYVDTMRRVEQIYRRVALREGS